MEPGKETLHRIVSMLTKMTGSTGGVREDGVDYGENESDFEHEHEHEHEHDKGCG